MLVKEMFFLISILGNVNLLASCDTALASFGPRLVLCTVTFKISLLEKIKKIKIIVHLRLFQLQVGMYCMQLQVYL